MVLREKMGHPKVWYIRNVGGNFTYANLVEGEEPSDELGMDFLASLACRRV